MKKLFLIFLLTLTYTINLTTNAEVRFVSKIGSSTPPYTSWATAADSIQKCINFSQSGDTIYVANGTYYEKVVMIPGLTLIGNGIDSCTVDVRALEIPTDHFAIEIYDSCTITGFNVIVSDFNPNADPYRGTGILAFLNNGENGWNILIENNKVSQARYGISCIGNEAIIRNNLIKDVLSGIDITGFIISQQIIIENNLILLNIKRARRGITYSLGVPLSRIVNNLIIFENSEGTQGIYPISNDSCFVANNAILYYSTPRLPAYGYLIYNGGTKLLNNVIYGDFRDLAVRVENNHTVKNNIVANSSTGVVAETPVPSIIYKYNNVWDCDIPYTGFTPDTTNPSLDPMFNSVDSADVHLQKYSPMIDSGDPNIKDVDGSRSDLGIYGGPFGEIYTYQDLAPRPPIILESINDSDVVEITWKPNTEADFHQYYVYRDTVAGFTADSSKLIFFTSDTSYKENLPISENIYYKLTSLDNQGNESKPSEEIAIILTGIKDYHSPIAEYKLYQNYPNPFNPSTKIGYRIKQNGYVKLTVYDIKGERITELVNKYQYQGYYQVEFTGKEKNESGIKLFASGIYLYKLEVISDGKIPVFTDIKKMILIK